MTVPTRAPRVLVSLLSLTPASLSGVSFVRGMLPALVDALGGDRVVVLCDRRAREVLPALDCELDERTVADRRPARLLAERVVLTEAARKHGADATYVPDGQLLLAPALPPAVVALHFHLNFSRPQDGGAAQRLYWKLFYDGAVRRTAERAFALVAPTKAFAEEFEALVPQARGRVRVAWHGVGREFTPDPPSDARERPSVLAVVNRFGYKNLAGARRIFAAAAAGLPHELRVAGAPAAQDAFPSARVRFLGPLGPAELAAEYRNASALLFPSLVESFGLPVVEAMACGTPVACSRLPSLTEVSAGAAMLADPNDEEAFAVLLRRILTDEALAGELREAGRARATSFSWANAGRRTADLLREAAGSRA